MRKALLIYAALCMTLVSMAIVYAIGTGVAVVFDGIPDNPWKWAFLWMPGFIGFAVVSAVVALLVMTIVGLIRCLYDELNKSSSERQK